MAATIYEGQAEGRFPNLETAVGRWLWPTPTAQSSGTNQGGGAGRVGPVRPSLETLVKTRELWATPTTRDWKDGASPSEATPTNSLLGRQAPRSGIGGPESSGSGLSSRRQLNPRFVAWLMNWPVGWTEVSPLAQSNFERWETASSRLLRRLLSEFSPDEPGSSEEVA